MGVRARPAPGNRDLITASPKGTEAAGYALGRLLHPGMCVCLIGPLGAGKTRFVSGALRALGSRGSAASPTFVLAREYRGRIPAVHLDLYRLTVRAEERGLLDYLDGRRIVFVEWADRDRSLRTARPVVVRIGRLGGNRRRIRIGMPS